MNPARRLLLRGALPSAALSIALAAGLMRPGLTWAANAPRESRPEAGKLLNNLLQALQTAKPTQSDAIRILVPEIAVDGATLFMETSTTLPEVDGIVIYVEHNPQPLVATFWIGPEMVPAIQTRIKVSQTSNIWVIVRSRGQFFMNKKMVKVTQGGCGVGLN